MLNRVARVLILLLLITLGFPGFSRSAGASLFKDLNRTGPNGSSDPLEMTASRNLLYLTMDDGVHGRELWKSDGTPIGTSLVKDLVPGSDSVRILRVTDVSGIIYFVASQETAFELWKSDGTESGTVRFYSFRKAQLGSGNIVQMTGYLNRLIFTLDTLQYGRELWISDGTEAGTRILKDICPGACSSLPENFRTYHGWLLFSASQPGTGMELWRSDGTTDGTTLFADIARGPDGSFPSNLRIFQDRIYFSADDPRTGRELWKTDGTAGGTRLVLDLNPGPASSFASPVLTFRDTLLIRSGSYRSGVRLRSLDAFERLTQISPASGWSGMDSWIDGGSRIYFRVSGPGGSLGLWTTDGTSSGTKQVLTRSGTPIFFPNILTRVGSKVMFLYGISTWISDGTSAGTVPFLNYEFQGGRAVGASTYFPCAVSNSGTELCITAGTRSTTRLIKDVRKGNGSSTPRDLITVKGFLWFTAEQGGSRFLFKSNGTPTGTMRFWSKPVERMLAVNDRFIFVSGQSLWVSDGTVGGSRLLKRGLRIGDQSAITGNSLVFAGIPSGLPQGRAHVWRTDGTPEGTQQLHPDAGIPQYDLPNPQFTQAASLVYFQAFGEGGNFLWATDGTPSGTRTLKNLGNGYPAPDRWAVIGNELYFPYRTEVWKSDGTSGGTVRVQDLGEYVWETAAIGNSVAAITYRFPDSTVWWQNGNAFLPMRFDGTIYFTTPFGGKLLLSTNRGLWECSGSEATTKFLAPVEITYRNSPQHIEVEGKLYFGGYDTSRGAELWVTDGTSGGTIPIRDIYPDTYGSYPENFHAFGPHLYFTADNGRVGRELWRALP